MPYPSLNQVTLIGRLADTPVATTMSTGKRIVDLAVETGAAAPFVKHRILLDDEFLAQAVFGALKGDVGIMVTGELAYDAAGAFIYVGNRRGSDVRVLGAATVVAQAAPGEPARQPSSAPAADALKAQATTPLVEAPAPEPAARPEEAPPPRQVAQPAPAAAPAQLRDAPPAGGMSRAMGRPGFTRAPGTAEQPPRPAATTPSPQTASAPPRPSGGFGSLKNRTDSAVGARDDGPPPAEARQAAPAQQGAGPAPRPNASSFPNRPQPRSDGVGATMEDNSIPF